MFELLSALTTDNDMFCHSPLDQKSRYLPTRQEIEIEKDLHRKFQETSQAFWSEINEDLGDLTREWHELQNMLLEFTENICDTLENHKDSLDIQRYMSFLLSEQNPPQVSDHLFSYRIGYTHHGLYVGNNHVIHYENGSVHRDSLENFRRNAEVFILPEEESPLRYSDWEVISRAESRLGEDTYNLIYNNCEHFVRWCRCGREP